MKQDINLGVSSLTLINTPLFKHSNHAFSSQYVRHSRFFCLFPQKSIFFCLANPKYVPQISTSSLTGDDNKSDFYFISSNFLSKTRAHVQAYRENALKWLSCLLRTFWQGPVKIATLTSAYTLTFSSPHCLMPCRNGNSTDSLAKHAQITLL